MFWRRARYRERADARRASTVGGRLAKDGGELRPAGTSRTSPGAAGTAQGRRQEQIDRAPVGPVIVGRRYSAPAHSRGAAESARHELTPSPCCPQMRRRRSPAGH